MFIGLFNISEGEFLLVALAALLLFGSKGLPDLLRSLGRGLHQVRQASDSVRREIRDSMYQAELEIQRRRFELENASKADTLNSNPKPDQESPPSDKS
ncbi:MAG: twin-arginine translocase TatA/TatE family subunit [Flavobacteriales bacterium]|nr:twin-arginine translocase TatA/TatE family subunit [Flavobacteriales bacterium]MCX7649006.1 twin-arginine translocase TatA/TatE family subunit [Flavobacteriales bacterium]MDW8431072.1 twin-arginine translocase TatA/TatE family subunit [Flavobacteriales bacterium]